VVENLFNSALKSAYLW